MPSLAEAQTLLRNAIVENRPQEALLLLLGGRDPGKRLAIHQRHYEASLTRALFDKFPATTWLIGATTMTEAARAFVQRHPPSAACIAEYGVQFPCFLEDHVGTDRVPYLRSFAELEWHLAHAAIAIDRPPIGMDAFATIEADVLPDIRLSLQPGLCYCAAAWPIDNLIEFYLSEAAPERHVFEPTDVNLEICGARGEFRIQRLDPATYLFRNALAERQTIGVAAEQALQHDPDFDPGQALTTLVAGGLVIATIKPFKERRHGSH
jgi:Putative DNA-binding domain